MAVCGSCRSVVTFGERAAEVAGTMSVLPPPRSKLFVGATGRFHGKNFSVAGRVRYGYARGYWDEWYLFTDTGETAWLSEDARSITFEQSVPDDVVAWMKGLSPGPTELGPGDTMEVQGHGWFRVVERDTATVEGGEGELPFVVISGQSVTFLDLESSDGSEFTGTYEWDAEGSHRLYIGRPVHGGELELDWTRQEIGMEESIPLARKVGDGRERVQALDGVRALKCGNCAAGMEVDTTDGVPDAVQCPYCGTRKNLKPREEKCPQCDRAMTLRSGDEAASAACRSCGTVSRVSGDGLRPLQIAAAKNKPYYDPPLKLHQPFRWEGQDYEAVAWIVYKDDEGYTFEEQLLFGETGGYLWLSFYNNHCTIGRRVFDGPHVGRPEDLPSKLLFRGHNFRRTEVATSKVVHVVGELPWICQVGDTTRYAEAVHEPFRLAGEWTQTENEWFLGRYLTRDELTACTEFGVNLGPVKGVIPHQPYPRGRAQAFWVWTLALILSVLGIVWTESSGETVTKFRMNDSAFTGRGAASKPFDVKAGDSIQVQLSAPKLKQGWIYLLGTVAKAEGGPALAQFSAEMASFDTGEDSSDTRETAVDVTFDEAGSYRIILRAQADRVVYAKAQKNLAYRPGVRVDLVAGKRSSLFFIIFAVFAGIIWAYLLIDRAGFTTRKNLEVDEDEGAVASSDDWDDWDDPW